MSGLECSRLASLFLLQYRMNPWSNSSASVDGLYLEIWHHGLSNLPVALIWHFLFVGWTQTDSSVEEATIVRLTSPLRKIPFSTNWWPIFAHSLMEYALLSLSFSSSHFHWKLLVGGIILILLDSLMNFRLEYLYPVIMFIRSVYDSYKYQGFVSSENLTVTLYSLYHFIS